MARNKVQFQKGMSLNIFLQYYGAEDQCFEALYKWRWPKGFRCPSCGHDRSCQLTNRKLQQCNRCHHQTSITAGTILESTKLPLTIWFQAIYLISQGKKCISVMQLHRQLGISYNAAWGLKHKLMQVMMERDQEYKLSGLIEIDDAYLGGERTGCKPGRGAADKSPFVAAVEKTEEGHPLRIKLSAVKGFRKTEIAAWSKQHLTSGSIVVSDGLSCFTALAEEGYQHDRIICGGGRASVEEPKFYWVNVPYLET
jgi:transposase-like protein